MMRTKLIQNFCKLEGMDVISKYNILVMKKKYESYEYSELFKLSHHNTSLPIDSDKIAS